MSPSWCARARLAAPEYPELDFAMGTSLDHWQAASIHAPRLRRLIPTLRVLHHSGFRLCYRLAIGPHAGRKALTLYSVPPLEEEPIIPLLARMQGFSLHAGTVCEAHQRSKLERPCHYIARPPIATKRLSVDGHGRVM